MTTFAFARTTFTKAKRFVATTIAAVLLAVGVGAGLAVTAPTASAATLGSTHCFASTKNGPHTGCQLDHADSVTFRKSFFVTAAGTWAVAVKAVCTALVEAGPAADLCMAAAAGISVWVSSYAPTLGPKQCIEIGVGVDSTAPYKLDAGVGYIKRIPCSVE